MIRRELPSTPAPRAAPQDDAHGMLVALNRYAATFDLMLSAWRDRSIYDSVKEELGAVVARQKALVPEAGVAMMGLAMAHSDIAALLLDMQVADARGKPPRFTADDLARRRAVHDAAVEELRSYVLRRTH